MTKKQLNKLANEKDQEEREFMLLIESAGYGDWCCGIRTFEGTTDKIFGYAATEEEAERYLALKLNRNGGFYPVRLGCRIGWWLNEGVKDEHL